jgi:hypothetical protein
VMSKLPIAAKKTVKKASREAIEESFSFLKRHFRHNRWLGSGNRYRTKTIERLSADSRHGRTVNHLDLTQYIAASAPLHCADGWSLLGRAVDCHARRDNDSARHLAYYAELRAAISLLAAEGIAIFNTNHIAVEKLRQCNKFGGNTHKIAWQALEYWAELKRSADLLGRSIRVNGITLGEWLENFPPRGTLRAIGSRWLRTWGLDLRLFSDDRDMRNEASYRPTKLTERAPLDVDDAADFLCSLWSLYEPTALALFGNLDKHLLRLALEETFHGVRGTAAAANPAQFRIDVEAMLGQIVPEATAQRQWFSFFTRATEPDDPVVLSQAKQTELIDTPKQHLQMISRAALLLRVATAANWRLLQETHVSGADVRFWWSVMGDERGLWAKANQPTDMTDLWADAEAAVRNITAWRKTTAVADRDFVRWRQERSYDISVLGGCERIALWGLGL